MSNSLNTKGGAGNMIKAICHISAADGPLSKSEIICDISYTAHRGFLYTLLTIYRKERVRIENKGSCGEAHSRFVRGAGHGDQRIGNGLRCFSVYDL